MRRVVEPLFQGRGNTMEGKKKILIADANESFRSALVQAIQSKENLELVGQTGDGQEAIDLAKGFPQTFWCWIWYWGVWMALMCWMRSNP